jgi:Glyoxalase-like domain
LRSTFRDAAACRDPHGIELRFFFDKAPEGKVAKNRVHFDIHVEPDRKAHEVARLADLGAELVSAREDRGPRTYVVRSRGQRALRALTLWRVISQSAALRQWQTSKSGWHAGRAVSTVRHAER